MRDARDAGFVLQSTPFALTRRHTFLSANAFAHLPAMVALAIPYLLLFPPLVPHLGLYFDDYWHRQMSVHAGLALVRGWPVDYRPLQLLPWLILHAVGGPGLGAYYFLLACGLYATSLCLYWLVYVLSRERLLAAGAALLWTCYPADTGIFWLDTYAYRSGAICALLALFLTLQPTQMRRWRVAGVLVCIIGALASNELYLGILLLVVPATIYQYERVYQQPYRQPVVLITSVLTLYVVYRFWLGPHVLQWPDYKDSDLSLSVTHALRTLSIGMRTLIPDAWAATIGAISGRIQTGQIAGSMIVALCIISVALGLYAYARWRGSGRSALRAGFVILALGLMTVLAGLLPLAPTTDSPTLDLVGSRVNAAAMLGAAPVLAAVLWIIVQALPGNRGRRNYLFLLLLLPLCIAGAMRLRQAGVAYAARLHTQTAAVAIVRAHLTAAQGPRLLVVVVEYQRSLAPSRFDQYTAQQTLRDAHLPVTLEPSTLPPTIAATCQGPRGASLRLVVSAHRTLVSLPVEWGPSAFPLVLGVADGHVVMAREGQVIEPPQCVIWSPPATSEKAHAPLPVVICHGDRIGPVVLGCTTERFVGIAADRRSPR